MAITCSKVIGSDNAALRDASSFEEAILLSLKYSFAMRNLGCASLTTSAQDEKARRLSAERRGRDNIIMESNLYCEWDHEGILLGIKLCMHQIIIIVMPGMVVRRTCTRCSFAKLAVHSKMMQLIYHTIRYSSCRRSWKDQCSS